MPPKPFSNIFNIQCLSLAVGMLMTLVVNTLGATAPHPLVLGVLGALGLAMMVMSHLVAKSLSNPSLVVSMYFPFGLLYLISHSATASHPRTAESDSGTAEWENSSEDGSDTGSDGDGCIDLTHERVLSLQKNPRRVNSVYAKKGGSMRRIKAALESPVCHCGCAVPLKVLVRLCVAFWSLLKSTQDSLLWSIQHESGKRRKKTWHLQGLTFHWYFVGIVLAIYYII